ncbi:MAG TPA: ABC transporter ATP-binding protein [Rhizobiaceae bacterium]|nr:ABC transporter ATP-binding protein [Rhizobiaceae bacterium]
MTAPILEVRSVVRTYPSRGSSGWRKQYANAVDGVDLDVNEGETLAIVGESGSGKSTLAKLMLRLEQPSQGSVLYRGVSLDKLDRKQWRTYRRDIQAVFQDPSSSLNPRMRVEQSLGYVARRHGLAEPARLRAFLAGHLAAVGLDPPEQYLTRYPHQLSGGQQQRIAIARAIMLEPRLIVADEPLSSLDISIQAQILDLMRELSRRMNVGFVLISHDLNAVQSIAGRTAVMQHGRIVEIGRDIFDAPAHPYTRLLLEARLSANPREARTRQGKPLRTQARDELSAGSANMLAASHGESAEATVTGKT